MSSSAKGTLVGVIVQFGGQTPLKLAEPLERGRRPDPRHHARRHRPGRGPRAVPAAAAPASSSASRATASPDRPPRRAASSPDDRLSRGRSARPTCSAAAPWRSSATTSAARALHPRGGGGVGRQPGADRPLSVRRHRGRRRCDLRRPATSSSPASWSISRRPASIPATRACSLPPCSLTRETIAELERQTARAGAGAERRRPDERAVRHQGRRRSTCSRSIRAPRAPCPSSPR